MNDDDFKEGKRIRKSYPMTWDDVEDPVYVKTITSESSSSKSLLKEKTTEELGYKPVMSELFSSFSGACRLPEFLRATGFCFLWGIVYVFSFMFVYYGVLARVASAPLIPRDDAAMFAGQYCVMLIVLFGFVYFIHVWLPYFRVLVRRFHAHGWSFTKYALMPLVGYWLACFVLEVMLNKNITDVYVVAFFATIECLLVAAYWVYNCYVWGKLFLWAKIDTEISTNNPATTRLLNEMKKKS